MKKQKNGWFTYLMLSFMFSTLAVTLQQPLIGVSALLMAIAALLAARKTKKK